MATYAIGDIHGCARTLQALLAQIQYRPGEDRVWLTGDLVNRGPDSLGILRWAVQQGESLVCVLGNHEIHLLGNALQAPGYRMRSAFEPILAAPDASALLSWLAARPLLHREAGWVMVHAGLLPAWDLESAFGLASRCQQLLRGGGALELLSASKVAKQSERIPTDPQIARLAEFLQAVTLLRLVDERGQRVHGWVDEPQQRPAGTHAWFDAPGRQQPGCRILFGHWATLGLMLREDVCCLDSGCVWGGHLSALRLDDGRLFQQELLDA